MKISCIPISLFKELATGSMSIQQWAKAAKNIGFDGIDISIMFLESRAPVYLNKLVTDLEALAMPIVMMTTYSDFTNPDSIQRQREYDYLVHDVALCSQLKIRYLRISAGQAHPSVSRKEGIKHVVSNFRHIDAIGEKYGVTLLFEDHSKPGAWDYYDFSFDPGIFLEILGRIKNTSIKVNFDTGNIIAYGENPLVFLEKIYDKIETVHVSDMEQYGSLNPASIGSGVVPNKEIFRFIKSRGFDGWLCIEEASGNGLSGIKSAYEFVRNSWMSA